MVRVRRGGMSSQTPAPKRSLLVPRIVAVAFVGSITVLGVTSWDIARGRVPETASPLINDLLQTPENRRCSRDASDVLVRHMPVGTPREAALGVLSAAVVVPPRPWFWQPAAEDSTREQGSEVGFVRAIRYTAFGNQKVSGTLRLENGVVGAVSGQVVCAFG